MGLAVKTAARFLKEEGGATAIEYALIASGTFFAILTIVLLVGVQLADLFQALIDGFDLLS